MLSGFGGAIGLLNDTVILELSKKGFRLRESRPIKPNVKEIHTRGGDCLEYV